MVDPQAKRAQANTRKRRYRARQRTGAAVLQVPVADLDLIVATLLARHLLTETASRDRRKVAAEVGKAVDAMFAAARDL